MSTLNSASTLADVKAAYMDNASYEEDDDVTKAKAFITACRILINLSAGEAAEGPERLRLDENLRQYRAEMEAAQRWLRLRSGGSRIKHPSFANFRC